LPEQALGFRVQLYGMTKHRHLFSARQLAFLTTLCDFVDDARERISADAAAAGLAPEDASAYGTAVATYLGLGVSKLADYNSTLVLWSQTRDQAKATFARHALPMVWDYAEVNPLAGAAGDLKVSLDGIAKTLERLPTAAHQGIIRQLSATDLPDIGRFVFATDPPYYDNIGYADLSDFFYVWLRRALSRTHPELLGTMLVPKKEELIATPYRFAGNSERAKEFFESGLGKVFQQVRSLQAADFPFTVFYAFKQSEDETEEVGEEEEETTSRISTGWETMLQSLIWQGFQIDGTWPLRTERSVRSIGLGTNALASSIVLVCRPRPKDAGVASRRDFLAALKKELPEALRNLQKGNIAPVDLAQAAIGPGMAVFSRYVKVMESDGSAMTVRAALGEINRCLDEVLAEQEGEFDADTRWALAWFDQYGFGEGPYGTAETLSTAKNTSVDGMKEAGILLARAGKVRLLRTEELAADWDPATDGRLTMWEVTHYLIRELEAGGSQSAGGLLARLTPLQADAARDLAYRLYSLCERRKWAKEALAYNALVTTWGEVGRRASEVSAVMLKQTDLGM
jgi:putative DNA methylase